MDFAEKLHNQLTVHNVTILPYDKIGLGPYKNLSSQFAVGSDDTIGCMINFIINFSKNRPIKFMQLMLPTTEVIIAKLLMFNNVLVRHISIFTIDGVIHRYDVLLNEH